MSGSHKAKIVWAWWTWAKSAKEVNIQVFYACFFLLLRNKDGNCVENPNIYHDPLCPKYFLLKNTVHYQSSWSITLVTTSNNVQSLGFGSVSGPVIHWSSWVSLPGIQSRNAACGNWEHNSWESSCGGDGMGIMKLACVMRGYFLTRIQRNRRNNDPEDGPLLMVNFWTSNLWLNSDI